jgi:chromosome segregation ATPase
LNDYPLLFRELNIAGYQLDKMLEEERRQVATMEVALQKSSDQITAGEDEQMQLNTDITNLQNDVDLAQAHLDKLASLLMARQQKINALFAQTQAMAQRKADLESGLVKEIDERTSEAIQN